VWFIIFVKHYYHDSSVSITKLSRQGTDIFDGVFNVNVTFLELCVMLYSFYIGYPASSASFSSIMMLIYVQTCSVIIV